MKNNHEFIAYYRVSTKRQGYSGLGLEAQRATVLNFIKHNGNKVIGEYTEIESGRNNERPELSKAVSAAKDHGATLVIAKLDRLSRNLSFISSLMDSKVKFICCDMPDATDLTIHIFASLAEWETKRISERIKEALDAKRKREPSWKPGTPNLTRKAMEKAWQSTKRKARTDQAVRHAYHFIKPLKEKGVSYHKIADQLNSEGYRTCRGKLFHDMQVYNIFKRLNNQKNT